MATDSYEAGARFKKVVEVAGTFGARSRRRCLRAGVADESGVVLVMALLVLMVLSLSLVTVIQFTSAGSRHADLSVASTRALALAEGGVNHGASALAANLQTNGAFVANLTGTSPIQGVNVPWTAMYDAGSSPKTWLVSATAALPNPTGPASDVPRTVQARFAWNPLPDPPLWRGLYVGNPSVRPLMSNSTASIKTNVYARGDLTLTQGKYLGESFQVWGKLTLDSSVMYDTSIGASDRINCSSDYKSFKADFPAPCTRPTHQVSDFRVKDGCNFRRAGPDCRKVQFDVVERGPNGKIWLDCTTPPSPSDATPCSAANVTSPAFSAFPDDIS